MRYDINGTSLDEPTAPRLRASASLREPTPILRPLLHFHARQEGAVLVFVALILAVLLGFAALAVDFGSLFEDRGSLQNAVDAAALAGVHELPENPVEAESVARTYFRNNMVSYVGEDELDILAAQLEVRFEIFPEEDGEPNRMIVVTAHKQNKPILRLPLFQFAKSSNTTGEIPVAAQAKAVVVTTPMCQIWPMAIPVANPGDRPPSGVPIKVVVDRWKNASEATPGNWGYMRLQDRTGTWEKGKSDLGENIREKGCLTGNTVNSKPGSMQSPLLDSFLAAIRGCCPDYQEGGSPCLCVENLVSTGCGNSACPMCTAGTLIEDLTDFCSCIGLIPIVVNCEDDKGGTIECVVDGFSVFNLTGVERVDKGKKDDDNSKYTVWGQIVGEIDSPAIIDPNYSGPLYENWRGYFLWK